MEEQASKKKNAKINLKSSNATSYYDNESKADSYDFGGEDEADLIE